jgi:hypothetical protein
MIFANEIAQRLDSFDNESLVDFFPVHIPCQVLVVDTVGVERRATPAMTHFILRAVSVGLDSINAVAGMLGIDEEHCQVLMRDLELGEYIGAGPDGAYKIWRRGNEILNAEGENSPIDRRSQIVWDPICKKFLGRVPMYTRHRAGKDGVFVPLPGAFAIPELTLIGPAALKEIQLSATGGRGGRTTTYEVLRVTTIQKSIARYREAVALVYKGEKGEYILRMATSGNFDEELTAACAQAGVAKLVGVDKMFASRHGCLAVRKRYADIAKEKVSNTTVETLVKRRSVLRFKVDLLNARILENEREDLLTKRIEATLEIEGIDAQLKMITVIPVRCHEIRGYLLDAFRSAKRNILITTTMPVLEQFDFEVSEAVKACISRGVIIEMCIADRPTSDDGMLAKLDKLSQSNLLKVNFLAEPRTVFEIVKDSLTVAFSNGSPLGARQGPIPSREFVGFFISTVSLTERYIQRNLNFGKDDFVSRIRPTIRDTGAKPYDRASPSSAQRKLRA